MLGHTRLTLSLPKKIAFAAITMALVFVVCVAALLGFDIYLHHRVQYEAGVNVWGYRGDVVGKKKPGETRIVALGGSTAFGYGLPWNESWPYYLEQKINARRAGRTAVSVVNLGVPTDSARSFVATLGDYEYLNYDIVCLYQAYMSLGRAINIQDKSLVCDGIHLIARGNAIIADALAPVPLEMVQ